MNEENPRVETEDRAPNQVMTSPISEAATERALRGILTFKMWEKVVDRRLRECTGNS